MRKLVAATLCMSVLIATTVAALAQSDVIAERKALMKANGAAAGQLSKIAKGDEAYDAVKVKAALDTMAKDGAEFGTKFPVGSETGATSAGPKIWQDSAGFQAEVAKFQAAVASAQTVALNDVDGLKASMGPIGASCQSCHTNYRVRK